jgi:hypothetical protein
MKKSLLLIFVLFFVVTPFGALAAEEEIDTDTGLIIAPGFEQVKETCTKCHSPMLITQNKADRDGWLEMIRWMQAKQGLWQLDPETEDAILDYLAANYGPTAASRRPPIQVDFSE